MKIYIAGNHPLKQTLQIERIISKSEQNPFILESFFYTKNNPWIANIIPLLGDFLLDSGAFSFMQGKTHESWEKYTDEYAAYIVEHNIEKFFELDIDNVVGIKKVEELRDRLHQKVGRASIPVWHFSRGQDYFLRMCEEYNYVAFGGILTDGVSRRKIEKVFPWFIREAHIRGAKIHGLGYTNVAGLHKFHFDSVDSTSWLYGNRGGYLYRFDPVRGIIEQYQPDWAGRLKSHDAAVHNFLEWVKFQQYAERNL